MVIYKTGDIMGRKGENGFTLIELLVVIAVIALLMAVIMPALSKAKRHARLILCANNLANIAKGLSIQNVNNDNRFVEKGLGVPNIAFRDYDTNFRKLRQSFLDDIIMDNRDALFCPLVERGTRFSEPGIDSSNISTVTSQMKEDAEYFYIEKSTSTGILNYYGNYSIFAGVPDTKFWLFDRSGNNSGRKPPMMSSRDCLAADFVDINAATAGPYDSPAFQQQHIKGYNHGRVFQYSNDGKNWDGVNYVNFIDSNAVFGDLHVDRHKNVKNWVYRTTASSGLHPITLAY